MLDLLASQGDLHVRQQASWECKLKNRQPEPVKALCPKTTTIIWNLILSDSPTPNQLLNTPVLQIFANFAARIGPWKFVFVALSVSAVNLAGVVVSLPSSIRQILDVNFYFSHSVALTVAAALALLMFRILWLLVVESMKAIDVAANRIFGLGKENLSQRVPIYEITSFVISILFATSMFLFVHLRFPIERSVVAIFVGASVLYILGSVWIARRRLGRIQVTRSLPDEKRKPTHLLIGKVSSFLHVPRSLRRFFGELRLAFYPNSILNLLIVVALMLSYLCGVFRYQAMLHQEPVALFQTNREISCGNLLGVTGTGAIVAQRQYLAGGEYYYDFTFFPFSLVEHIGTSEHCEMRK